MPPSSTTRLCRSLHTNPALTLRSTSIPFAWRTLLLASAFFLVLVFNADHVRGQTPPDEAPPPDDHGDTASAATNVPVGSFAVGRIDPSTDFDYFEFDLTNQHGPTDVWIYTLSNFDTIGDLYDSDLDLVTSNDDSRVSGRFTSFHIRALLEPGIYYVSVGSYEQEQVGDYNLFVELVFNPSDSIDDPTQLDLYSPAPGRLDIRGQSHYFRMDFTEHTYVYIHAENMPLYDEDQKRLHLVHLDAIIFDAEGQEVPVNVYDIGVSGFLVRDDFAPGTYHLKVTTYPDQYDHHFPAFYTIQAWLDRVYPQVLESCGNATNAIYGPTVDPLFACQWHLRQRNGEDVNVVPTWNQGYTGEGITVAVVDNGMDWTHEDLIDNVDISLNHDYTGEGDIHHPYAHHGTNVAGVIAARDNDVGVRGVAPRATIYGYNLLAVLDSADALLDDVRVADAAARNAEVTALSNNSWGPPDSPRAELPSALWELAIENGVTKGYDSKGVFYVWAAGNGHLRGDDANLDGFANFYAVTAACAVNELGTRSTYSEMGASLWVCAPSNNPFEEGYRGIVTTENSDRYSYSFGGTSSRPPPSPA